MARMGGPDLALGWEGGLWGDTRSSPLPSVVALGRATEALGMGARRAVSMMVNRLSTWAEEPLVVRASTVSSSLLMFMLLGGASFKTDPTLEVRVAVAMSKSTE